MASFGRILAVGKVCHLPEFYVRLGLDRARVISIAPYRRAASVRNGPGVQIDLLVQTPETYFVVEIKRKRRIGVEIEREVEEKVSRLRVRKGVSVRTALVYQGELDAQVREDGYFSAIIDAESLLGTRNQESGRISVIHRCLLRKFSIHDIPIMSSRSQRHL